VSLRKKCGGGHLVKKLREWRTEVAAEHEEASRELTRLEAAHKEAVATWREKRAAHERCLAEIDKALEIL
jgi:hypothetical protein